MAGKRKGLGKGLDALLGAGVNIPPADVPVGDSTAEQTPAPTPADGKLMQLPVDLIQRGKYQPRRDMHPEALEELADSIKAQGVMQPIIVRPISEDKYEIIAGERRWRATQQAGLDKIPAVVRDVPDEAAIAMALIENIQREDLNPIEEAVALKRLQDEFELTHLEVAQAVGKSRTTVTNLLRLIALDEEVKKLLEHGDLEMGHARALLSLTADQQRQVARQIVGKGMTVRQAEALVRKIQEEQNKGTIGAKPQESADIKRLQNELSETLGAGVAIQHSAKGKGKLVISYNNLDELDGILSHIK
ncbi:ParB/RepB/Spo0J family partition protein [Gilvimarinus agarilyticus]|uniref:ParB/RepB/Spo0J family partition protein n=1 Tax=unclassified Gilvimarinus TaxID=2642066 RepID=UPI001C097F4B|nr:MULTISPECIES: ParB/RepB/Spo0J family partition protein [unclassified Gilvimarinus]MBU2884203.1 ParB/RepB/Spo0J family partition protein [Gilvimarinus agarilyticus]MDO6569342.1 ParB/RepB/Spo0J family partition protein [Gilvimarinus sp. 2_MG-2023]MDO6747496.1 ParB/RepB/Spo0J family partition protein [Gilvimarinus sp. 1_MG-2023]